ncbi:MAG: DNA replication/repair protein RecF [Pseudomonadales bacterium]|nr:DNA replication/repair protein RecF [Pseudomonadales bacterium]
MKLSRISISGVRNINSTEILPSPALNLVVGKNGSGKTSFLESLYILGSGRSFRTTRLRRVVNGDHAKAMVYGSIQNKMVDIGVEHSQGVEVARNGKVRARQNGANVTSSSALAYSLPVQLINSDTFQLLAGGPRIRRQYMDWGLFHVEQEYASYWKRYSRALRQRNQLLRYGKLNTLGQELRPWNEELSTCATRIHEYRKPHLTELASQIETKFEKMCLVSGLGVSYSPGWDVGGGFSESLQNNLDRDRVLGHTKEGPHRADLRITLDGLPAVDQLSRGQSKMLVCALKLVQGDMLSATRGYKAIYLVDDLPSELDAENRRIFLSQLIEARGQVFVTAVDEQSITQGFDVNLPGLVEGAVFHVEQGSFSRVR